VSVYLSVCGDKQGKAARADTHPLDLLAARSNRLDGQCLEDSSSHCPFPVELVTNRAGQPLRGAARGAISIKEILGENRGTCI